jgi:iron complex outermembrane receptor protein
VNKLIQVLIALTALPGIALAQTDSREESDALLEEVIVTAQKREQKLTEIPQSIQLLDQDMLVETAIRDVSELITFVPGASEGLAISAGQRRLQIRGIYQESGSATVGYYLDEAPIDGDTAAPMGRLYDMQQVEILRGPQSTLYGNGAMGGVVRYIPNQPNLQEFDAGGRFGYNTTKGGDDGYYGDVFLNAPVVEDKLGVRLVASMEKLGGWVDALGGPEDINEADLRDVRLHVLWEPSEDWRIKLMYSDNVADQDGFGFLLSGLFPDDTITAGSPVDFQNNSMEVWSGTLQYQGFGFADLVSTFSSVDYQLDTQGFFDLPGLSAVTTAGTNKIETVSNETRLVSKGDGVFQWLVGTFLTDGETSRYSLLDWNPEIPPFFVDSETTSLDNRDSIAFFGEFSWALMDGRLIPLVGVRWSEEDFDGDTVTAAGRPDGQKFDSTNFRFNLSWLQSDTANYYLNVAEGFRSGVFNGQAICATHNLLLVEGECQLVQESDELISYEVGGKYTLLDGRMLLDLALYYIDWQRSPVQLPIGGLYATYDAGDAEIYGTDVSLVYRPASVEGLDFSLTANWLSAEYANVNTYLAATLVPPFTPESVGPTNGEDLQFVPEWTATLAVNYVWTLGNGWEGLANFSWNHLDGQFGQFGANTTRGDARDLLRARFGVTRDAWGVFLFGRNLLDEDATIFNQAPTGGVPVFTRDFPMQVGVEVTFDYN